ncbi:recombinase family protein [Vibrio sp. McD22-P3]|uniref:recombinase family protein n=1 Tax=Vibrio sp. McD22-P3 TaxID=2724880 RepID=UPI001F1C02D1|nr:recombinase family protein [Vibrio sp. McD22-P3]MCF4174546.1 recombinase family protein [Vibrio sp. McD22-P3]
MKVAAYIRVSTLEQVKYGDSLDGQKESAKRWARENGHTITTWYVDEGRSAYKGTHRPSFQKLIEDVSSGELEIDAILVFSLSRFSRRLLQQLNAFEILKNNNVTVLSITEPLPDDPSSNFLMTTVIGMVNEQQSQQNSKNVKERLADTARKNYFTGGRIPYGYTSIDVEGEDKLRRKKLEIHPDESHVVKKIFNLALNGINGKAMGIKAIYTWLNENGLTFRGKRWTRNSVNRILRNTTYIGEFVFRTNTSNSGITEEIIVTVPRIIEDDKFRKVGDGLDFRKPSNTEKNKGPLSKSLLTGILRCGKCGSNMSLMSGKSGRYQYYVCNQKKNVSAKACSCPYLSKEHIDKAVLGAITNEVLNIEHVNSCLGRVKEILDDKRSASSQSVMQLNNKRTRLEQSISTLLEQIGTGQLMSSTTVNQFILDKEKELAFVRDQLSELESLANILGMKFSKEGASQFIQRATQYILSTEEETLKQFLMVLVDQIVVLPNQQQLKMTCSNMGMLNLIPKTKMGTDFSVPIFVSMWR